MAKHKKHARRAPAHRNAATGTARPHRPQRPARRRNAMSRAASSSTIDTEAAVRLGIGALLGSAVVVGVANQDWMRPKVIAGTTAAVGATLMLASQSQSARLAGAGAAAAGAGALAWLAGGNAAGKTTAPTAIAEKPTKTSDPKPTAKPANADGLPPGALEAAYERARRRLEMTQGVAFDA